MAHCYGLSRWGGLVVSAIDLSRPLAPAEFAGMIGLSRQFIAELMMRGVLPRGATGAAWVKAYCAHLRAQAEDRDGTLADSRAALERARAAEVALRNAERRRTLADRQLVDDIIVEAGAALAAGLRAVPLPLLAEAWPDATEEQHALVQAELQRAASLAAAAKRIVIDEEAAA